MRILKSFEKALGLKKSKTAEEILEKLKELETKFHSKQILEIDYKQKQKILELEFISLNLYGFIMKNIDETIIFAENNSEFLSDKAKTCLGSLKQLKNLVQQKHKSQTFGEETLENWYLFLKEKNSEAIDLEHFIKSSVRAEKMKKTKEIISLLENSVNKKDKANEIVDDIFVGLAKK